MIWPSVGESNYGSSSVRTVCLADVATGPRQQVGAETVVGEARVPSTVEVSHTDGLRLWISFLPSLIMMMMMMMIYFYWVGGGGGAQYFQFEWVRLVSGGWMVGLASIAHLTDAVACAPCLLGSLNAIANCKHPTAVSSRVQQGHSVHGPRGGPLVGQ